MKDVIVITMAGLSSRFFDAGYSIPKYQLQLGGLSVFSRSVLSFSKYFHTDKFVFVLRDVYGAREFVTSEVQMLGIAEFDIVVLEAETRGQAETAYLATMRYEGDFPVYFFNIDTFRNSYEKPQFADQCDGYLEVFRAEGDNWSFVLPADSENVVKTAEKERISNLCSDGLYYFRRKVVFEQLFLNALRAGKVVRGEFYIAPLYNELIEGGGSVKYAEVDSQKIELCGTPAEYELLLNNYK